MVIQRWHSLFLLIAVIIMGCLSFSLLAKLTVEGKEASTIYLTDFPVLMVVDILVAVILFISIFMFKNLKTQMKVTTLSILLICCLAIGGAFTIFVNKPNAQIELIGALLLLVLALAFTVCAYRFMKKDYRLLRSADRLR